MFPGVISRDDAPHVILIRVGADMVIVDNPLSPSQQRALTEELGVSVPFRWKAASLGWSRLA